MMLDAAIVVMNRRHTVYVDDWLLQDANCLSNYIFTLNRGGARQD